jgi:hypothetical protein
MDFTAEGGSIGDVTFGSVYAEAGLSASLDYMTFEVYADQNVGDVTFGDITMINNNAHSEVDFDLYITAGDNGSGDIGNLTVGNLTAMASGSNEYSADIEIYAEGENVGDVTIGDIMVSALAGTEDATGTDVSASVSVDITALTGEIGDITIGNVTATATNSNEAYVNLYFEGEGSTDTDGNVGSFTMGNISLESHGILMSNDDHAFVGEDAQADVDEYQDRDGAGDQDGEAILYIDLSADDDLGSIVIGDIDLTVSAGGWAEVSLDGYDLGAEDTVEIGTITFNNVNVTTTYTEQYVAGTSDDLNGDGISEGGADSGPTYDTYSDTAVYQSAANVIMDLGAADVELAVNVVGDGSVGFVSTPFDPSNDLPEGNYLGITTDGDIKLDIEFNVTVAATDTYTIGDVTQNFDDQGGEGIAAGDIELGTVDYSGYVLTGSQTDTQYIDVSSYAGNITIIGSGRDDVITSNGNATTYTGGAGDDTFNIDDLNLGLTADYTADEVAYHTVTDFAAGPDNGDVLGIGFSLDANDYAEETASSFDQFIAVALEAMSDPDENAQVVSVQVGDDVWVAIDDDDDDEIDTIIKLVGVDLDDLNVPDFESGIWA